MVRSASPRKGKAEAAPPGLMPPNEVRRSDHFPLPPQGIPPFAALRAFEAVFRTGGIRKGAAHLGLSHAVVSRHIRLLEDWLGEPLLERSGNRLTLTEEGAKYHARISAALVEIAVATSEFRRGYDQGHLRLCCVPGLAIQWLSGQLAQFERSHPQFAVELKPADEAPNLLAHEADADIRYFRNDGPPSMPAKGLRYFELAEPEILAVASPEVAKRLDGQPAETLLRETLLHEENQVEWRAWLSRNGVDVDGSLPGHLCWHAHLAIAAARLGRGIALASHFLVSGDLERGELVEVAPPGARRVVLGSYTLVAREDRWSMPALAALRRFLRAQAHGVVPPTAAHIPPARAAGQN